MFQARWNPNVRMIMPVEGVDIVDKTRIRECIEISRLRRDWLRSSIETLSYMLRTYDRGIHARKVRKVLETICNSFERHLSETLKKCKLQFLTFTFASYMPEDSPRQAYSLELYKLDKWFKHYRKDWYFTFVKGRVEKEERRLMYQKVQSQRYWTKI